MNNSLAAAVGVIVVALAIGAYYLRKDPNPGIEAETPAPQQGMTGVEGMSGMSGMDGMSGMEGMSGMAATGNSDCTRYDLVNGAWVCTTTASGTGN